MSNQNSETQPIDLSKVSAEELAAALREKQKAARKKKEDNKKSYEKERDEIINDLLQDAIGVGMMMQALKVKAMKTLPAFREKMLEYGSLRKGENNKGTFEIKNDRFKIMFTHQIVKGFDERAELAEAKLKEFLSTTVKKRDQKLHDLILSLISRDTKTNSFDINLINRLYQMEDKFEEPNWVDAIRLFKESFSPNGTAQYVRFFSKNSINQWEPINLDFAKIKVDELLKKIQEPANA